jgi:hypothetical protein
VSQAGTADEVLAYLGRANLQRTALDKIAWRMRDRAFFGRALTLLRAGHAYDHTLWSHGILHADATATREYLAHADGFVGTCGAALSSALLTVDPVERLSYQRIEFEPLFNGRAHQFGRRREIQNHELANQYDALLTILACRPQLDAADWMSVTYYLLLQDRVQPALAAFAHVDAAALPTRLQYDYLRAYLDFFTADHALARRIAEGYRDHPVQRWRALFADVTNQLDEAEGKAAAVSDLDNRLQQQSASAAQAPALDLEIAGRTVTVQHQNLARCEVRYYRLDVESSFSTNPFVQQSQGNFGYIEPSRSDALTLAADRTSTSFELPAALQNGNVLVEVRGGGIARRRTSFANALAVQFATSYGQLKVASAADGKPLPRVYVKVYARQAGGQVRFHKDGYTDLRGRFDYASVSDAGAGEAERFAILVLSDTDGALIREVEPPAK